MKAGTVENLKACEKRGREREKTRDTAGNKGYAVSEREEVRNADDITDQRMKGQ